MANDGVFMIYTMTITTGNTTTSGIQLFDRNAIWALVVPSYSSWCVTATCNVRMEGSLNGSTFYGIGYSNSPATATTGFQNWEVAADAGGKMVICEAAQFTPQLRISVTNTATAAAEFYLIGKLI